MPIPVPTGLTAWWSSFYGDHQLVSVFIHFLHLVGVVLGGGTALFADRRVLGAIRSGSPEREAALAALKKAHAQVLPWIIVIVATGILMTAADTPTFLASKLYWIKMATVAILMANGVFMLLTERRARRIGVTAGWPRLATVSIISAVFWILILFLSALLTVAA